MARQQKPTRGFLFSMGDADLLVEFQYNPAQFSDRRSVNYAALNAPGRLLPIRQYRHGGDRSISFTVNIDGVFAGSEPGLADNDIRIARTESGSILPELDKYRAFLYPDTAEEEHWRQASGDFISLYEQTQSFVSPPTCLFGFGDLVIDCIVTEINITESLFNQNLEPLRAGGRGDAGRNSL